MPTARLSSSPDGGVTWETLRVATQLINVAATAITAGTAVTVHTPAAGNKFRLLGYHLSLSVAGSILFKDAGTEVLRTPLLSAGVGQASGPMGQGVLSSAAGNALQIDVSASGNVSGWLAVMEE